MSLLFKVLGTLGSLRVTSFVEADNKIDAAIKAKQRIPQIIVSRVTVVQLCLGCGQDVRIMQEYCYMVNGALWRTSGFGKAYACIGCLETALGRHLTSADFPREPPINWRTDQQSFRLRNRIGEQPTGTGDVN